MITFATKEVIHAFIRKSYTFQTHRTIRLAVMFHPWLPAILLPDFTWTPRNPTQLSEEIPPTPKASSPLIRIFLGKLHYLLHQFSIRYCRWLGIPFDNQIIQLPFGLLLKWSDGTRLEEVLATQVCRAAGLPVPRILSYGDHPDTPHAPVSILMTRLPGREIGQAYPSLSPTSKTTALRELKLYLSIIRQWRSPWGEDRFCSITGGAIRSIRVPNHTIGPCESTHEFHEYLLAAARCTSSESVHVERIKSAKKLERLQRPGVKFTHGDLKHHNILVDEAGHITGFLDWEATGWYPEFWEYTTAMRFQRKEFWWYDFLIELGVDGYLEEVECETALLNLTSDSWSW